MREALLVLSFLVVSACGDTTGEGSSTGGAGAAGGNSAGNGGQGGTAGIAGGGGTGTAGTTAGAGGSGTGGGGTAGSGGDAGGSGGSGAAGSGGSGGTPVDCSGTFSSPVALWIEPTTASIALSPEVTEDELELFFVRRVKDSVTGAVTLTTMLTRRASKDDPFDTPVPVEGLSCGALPVRSLDVSRDGLRLYFSCWDDVSTEPSQLMIASRADRTAVFSTPTPAGSMYLSVGLDAAELTAYSTQEPSRVLHVSRRTSVAESFGASEVANVSMFAVSISNDGLELYGTVPGASAGNWSLAVSRRGQVGAPFDAPVDLGLVPPTLDGLGAPEISADCHSLYSIGNKGDQFGVYVAKR